MIRNALNSGGAFMYRPFDEFRLAGKLISVIGSGGKTTLLRHLSRRLPGTVILTTSTHILPFPEIPLVDAGAAGREQVLDRIRSALSRSRVVCLGKIEPSGKLADPSPVLPFDALLSEADHIIVEADGAAGHPLKAHRPWEPVIPDCSDLTVCVAGASGIGKPVSEVCHCPGLFAALAGVTPDEAVSPEHIAEVLNREGLADCYLINQLDALEESGPALRLCSLISKDAFPCSLNTL